MERRFSIFILLLIGFALNGCMPKVENEEDIPSVSLLSYSVEKVGNNTRIVLKGGCPEATAALRVLVSESASEHNVSAASSNQSVVEGSGQPVGSCVNQDIVITYPVPNPFEARDIVFKVKARLNNGTTSLEWANIKVKYSFNGSVAPGFAVTSGGRSTGNVGADLSMQGSAGIFHQKILLSGPSEEFRSGLHGVLLQ